MFCADTSSYFDVFQVGEGIEAQKDKVAKLLKQLQEVIDDPKVIIYGIYRE